MINTRNSFGISYGTNAFNSTCFFTVFETGLSVEHVKKILHSAV